MERNVNINMTGHTILVSGIELAPDFDSTERGPLDAPDWISAGCCMSGKHYNHVECPPIPRSVSREQKTC